MLATGGPYRKAGALARERLATRGAPFGMSDSNGLEIRVRVALTLGESV
jgi:hypothetical protein